MTEADMRLAETMVDVVGEVMVLMWRCARSGRRDEVAIGLRKDAGRAGFAGERIWPLHDITQREVYLRQELATANEESKKKNIDKSQLLHAQSRESSLGNSRSCGGGGFTRLTRAAWASSPPPANLRRKTRKNLVDVYDDLDSCRRCGRR